MTSHFDFEEDSKDEPTQPRSKRAKEALVPNSNLKDNTGNSATIKSDRLTKSDVFSRLTSKKSFSSSSRKKNEKKNQIINFFDNQYKQSIKGMPKIKAKSNIFKALLRYS